MPISATIREQLLKSFRVELAEHIQTMNDGLLAIEQQRVPTDQRTTVLDNIFRAAHSLKGAARAIGVTAVEQIAHALEDVLHLLQDDALELTPGLFTSCYQALDAIQAVQAAYEAGETTPPTAALTALSKLEPYRRATSGSPGDDEQAVYAAEGIVQNALNGQANSILPTPDRPAAPEAPAPIPVSEPVALAETIRVSAIKLDALMAQLSELLVTKIRAEQRLAQIQQAQEAVAQWQKDWLAVRAAYGRVTRKGHDFGLWYGPDRTLRRSVDALARAMFEDHKTPLGGAASLAKDLSQLLDYLHLNQERLRDVHAQLDTLYREYANDTMHMSLVIDALEQEIKRVRMLPLNTITGSFKRMVRDLAYAQGKEAVLRIVGSDVELDKRVLEQIKDPLIHLLRNAVDHGIEQPEQRVSAGKPRAGTITLSAEQLGKDIELRVQDDGKGIDLDDLRKAILRRGFDASSLDQDQLVDLMFNPGITTSPIITDVSGRGVGLDIVRKNVEALRGQIVVHWNAGQGTTFALTLPTALTSVRGLLVRVSGETFAVPHGAVERILTIKPDEIVALEGRDAICYNQRPLTLAHLGDVLELPRVAELPDVCTVLILMAAGRRLAFIVDELIGEQEVVSKGLGEQLQRVSGIAGATLLGNGTVVLVLNAVDLIKLALRGSYAVAQSVAAQAQASARPRKRILVVDDSITTRTLEKNILEAAGYEVYIATDGLEALSVIATDGAPDLIVSDIFMPRLDGFDLTRRLKSDMRTINTPIILVTSLDSPQDKTRGIEAGADAYIVKSRFDQNNLLETIEQLIV